MIIGLIISVFQAVTQSKWCLLAFVPKMIFVSAFILISLPWVVIILETYTRDLWNLILILEINVIDKLYNLKNQTNQKMENLNWSQMKKIEHEIVLTQNRIDSATVEKFGAISDFTILTMHKIQWKCILEN